MNKSSLLFLLGLVLPFHVAAQTPGPGHFFFQWPTAVAQCQLINLTWTQAIPPFQAWVVPIGGQPFIYNIPNSAYNNDTASGWWPIRLQLNQGTNYVMIMSDGHGIGSGGSSEVQIVASAPQTNCLNTAALNQTSKQFSFSVAGQAKQCKAGFEVLWDGSSEDAPYNFTVIPLDQSYYPFDVKVDESSGWTNDWVLNMTAGTRFTIVMNNKNGYGTGGAGGIYEVSNSTGHQCVNAVPNATGSWPIGLATNTLPPASNAAPNTDPGSPLTGGTIAGIVIGVLAFFALVGVLIWFLLRRKRRKDKTQSSLGGNNKSNQEFDLADGLSSNSQIDENRTPDGQNEMSEYGNPQPLVSPYPTNIISRMEHNGASYSAVPNQERRMSNTGTETTGGFAGLGTMFAGERYRDDVESRSGSGESRGLGSSGGGGGGGNRDSNQTLLNEFGENREGPGIAGPLPSKSTRNNRPHPSNNQSSGNTRTSVEMNRDSGKSAGRNTLPPGAASGSDDRLPGVGISGGGGGGGGGGMRVVNHDSPEDLPLESSHQTPRNSRIRNNQNRGSAQSEERRTQFRRHEDAGRVDVVDLPPLYTDVPRDEMPLDRSGSGEDQVYESGQSGQNQRLGQNEGNRRSVDQ